MIPSYIQSKTEQLARICRRHRVRRLDLFGSAARETFDPQRSDLDFVVEFEDLEPIDRAQSYFGLIEDLENLFEKDVDVVEYRAIRNPYLRSTVEESRTLIYAA